MPWPARLWDRADRGQRDRRVHADHSLELAYDRGSLAIAVAAAAFRVLAALWMPAGKAAAGAMHLH